jgi:hypothetical protein
VLRRLNSRAKRVPETASLGLVIGVLMLATSMVASEASRVFICTALLAVAATARVRARPVLVGAAAGLLAAGVVVFTGGLPDMGPLAGMPGWTPWLLVPAGALSVGVWRREAWLALVAYLVPVAILLYTAVAGVRDNRALNRFPMLAASGLVVGAYFAAIGRLMAWWVGGSLSSAVLGAVGGMLLSGIMFGALTVAMSSFDPRSETFEFLFLAGYVGSIIVGTVTGAFLGARRKRRRPR